MKRTSLIGLIMLFFVCGSHAATVAVIDSGVDIKHKDLTPYVWVNPLEVVDDNIDDDDNGYVDDINGWNFAENTNQVIDYKYLNLFTEDVQKFFDIQTKSYLGTITPEELTWIREKIKDQQFIQTISTYGNFMHGSHVTGIVVKETEETKIISIKLLATEATDNLFQSMSENDLNEFGDFFFKAGLKELALAQTSKFKKITLFVNGHKADVANGSFGTSFLFAYKLVNALYKGLFERDPSMMEAVQYSRFFMDTLLDFTAQAIDQAADTLFVFAAGNDATNNDIMPISPANAKRDNVISVAATHGSAGLASFSNFGIKTVDVAAPGVAIKSTIPGDKYLTVSGTSQAAPFVSNVAAQIKDANGELKPKDIKEIIIKTVDVKPFLMAKVRSGGMVNPARAIRAAQLSNEMELAEAINKANDEILTADAVEKSLLTDMDEMGDKELILPLPNPIQL